MLSVPERIGLVEPSIPVCLRIRSTSTRRLTLKLLSFEAEVHQIEQFR